MGFLRVNSGRRARSQPVTKRRKLRDAEPSVSPTPPARGPANIEMLSSDVLGLVFVYSGNLALAQASPILAQKLRRSRYLELSLLRSRLVNGQMTVPHWDFFTREHLEALGIEEFVSSSASPPFVPASLETNLTETNIDTIEFMVCRGCRVENSVRVYKALAERDHWRAVEQMAAGGHRADADIVVRALLANQGAELAIALLKLTKDIENNWDDLWAVQQAALRAKVPEVNTYVITG